MPLCWKNLTDWKIWKRLAQMTLERKDPKPTYCVDCLPDFQKRMIQENRCEYRRTVFIRRVHRDGATTFEGVRLTNVKSD